MNIKLYNIIKKLGLISLLCGCAASMFPMNNDENNEKKRSIEYIGEVENSQQLKKQKIDREYIDNVISLYVQDEQKCLKGDELKNMTPEERDYCYARIATYADTESRLGAIAEREITPLMCVIIKKNDDIIEQIEELVAKGERVSGEHVYVAMQLGLTELATILIRSAGRAIVQNYLLLEKNLIGLSLQVDQGDNVEKGTKGVLLELLKMGCAIEATDVLLLIETGNTADFTHVVNYIDVNMTINTRSLLSHCIMTKNPEFVKLVVKKGARVTQRDIIDNYILGVVSPSWDEQAAKIEIEYELTDECYEIAGMLGGKLPKVSNIMKENFPEDYKKMLKTELYQQFFKDYLLLNYIEQLGDSRADTARETIIKLLGAEADPNALGNFFFRGVSMGAMSALEMACNQSCSVTIFNLLSYGASLEEIIDNGYFEVIDEDETQKLILYCFWMGCLQKVPALLCDSLKKEEMQIKLYDPFLHDKSLQRRLLQFTPTFEVLLNEDNIDWGNVEGVIECFYSLFKQGHVLQVLSTIDGTVNLYRYLLRYPKAAELLLLHSPYRLALTEDKNSLEQWYAYQMKKNKNASGSSFYNGFLMLGNNKLLNQVKNQKFIDIVFEE